jgi:hypothetical protein
MPNWPDKGLSRSIVTFQRCPAPEATGDQSAVQG